MKVSRQLILTAMRNYKSDLHLATKELRDLNVQSTYVFVINECSVVIAKLENSRNTTIELED
jgi:hypothetical protein